VNRPQIALEFFNVILIFDAELLILGVDVADLIFDLVLLLHTSDDSVEVSFEVLNFLVNIFG